MERSDVITLANVVNEPIFQPRDRLVFMALTLLGVAVIGFFTFAWMKLPAWIEQPVAMVTLSSIIAIILLNNLGRWFLLPNMRKPKAALSKPGWKVAVVTTFVSNAEPLELLERTLHALVALDYPHETWVLDEDDDSRVKQLCHTAGAHHFSRKHLSKYQTDSGMFRKLSKHGNYNAWLAEVGFDRYDILAAFDPDHVPRQMFLTKVLGFFGDTRVGYVQAPQMYVNQNESFISRGAAEETYEFYSSVQAASYGKGFPLIIGCHNTHRIQALKEIGGFAPHDADDLLLTLLYHRTGWQGVYIPEILAQGLAPANWSTYLNQQRRWTRAVLDIKLRIAPSLVQGFSPVSRLLNGLHGLNYVHRSILWPVALIMLSSMLVTGSTLNLVTPETMFSGGLLLLVLMCWELYRQRFYLNRKVEQGFHWRAAILRFAKWPYQFMGMLDVLFDRRFPYLTTPKTGLIPPSPVVLWPHIATFVLVALAWSVGLAVHKTLPIALQACAGLVSIAMLGIVIAQSRGTGRPLSQR